MALAELRHRVRPVVRALQSRVWTDCDLVIMPVRPKCGAPRVSTGYVFAACDGTRKHPRFREHADKTLRILCSLCMVCNAESSPSSEQNTMGDGAIPPQSTAPAASELNPTLSAGSPSSAAPNLCPGA